MDEAFFKRIDFDFWCNSRRDIVLLLSGRGSFSISEVARMIGLSYGTTHAHIMKLHERGALDIKHEGLMAMVSLRIVDLEKLFSS
jgi:DNA-binding transcriptional ArsR family regulator